MSDTTMVAVVGFAGALVAAVIGGIITGRYTLKGVKEAHANDVAMQRENEENLVRSLMQSLHDEIDTLWHTYHNNIGNAVETLQDNQPFLRYYPVTQDYFTVYNANAILIGRISDHDLRRQIVIAYTKARGLIDSFRLNNDFLNKYEYWDFVYNETLQPAHRSAMMAYRDTLVNYARVIKEMHNDMRREVETLIRMLNRFGVIHDRNISQ
ncbi:MAG: hypothetical protein ACOYW7_05370 [Nitrospirota bacterium]